MSPFVLFFVALLAYYLLKPCFRPKNFPPGPVNFPLAGAFPHIGDDMLGFFKRCKKKYGKLWSFNMGSVRAMVVADFELFKEMSNRDEFLGRPTDLAALDGQLPDEQHRLRGIMFSQGEEWKQMRRFTLRNLRDFGFGKSSMGDLIGEEVANLVKLLKEGHLHTPTVLQGQMSLPTINSLWRLLTGEHLSYNDERFQCLINSINKMLTSVSTVGPLQVFNWLKYVAPEWSGYNTIMESQTAVHKMVQERYRAHEESYEDGTVRNLLDAFIRESKSPASSVYFRGQLGLNNCLVAFSNLFQGGSDTTATSLNWILYYLSIHPEVQDKMQAEIDSVVGRDRLPHLDDRPNLPYTEAVVHEVIRLASIGYTGVPRMSTEDAKLGGYDIPKGTYIMVDIYWMLRDSEHWKDGEAFNPERFLDTNGQFKQSDFNVTFGLGKRNCMGKQLALMQLFMFTAGLVQSLKFSLPEDMPKPDMKPIQGFVLGCPKYHICVNER